MRDEDWYSEFLERNPYAHWRTIRLWASHKYDIPGSEIEILMEMHATGGFTSKDFATIKLTHSWNKHRIKSYVEKGWIHKTRERAGRFRNFNVYEVTPKIARIVRKLNNIGSGKENFPEEALTGKWTYGKEKVYNKINRLKNQ